MNQIDIRVPALGESVTQATVGKWFKKPGEDVAVDTPLVELETDKVTLEVYAPADGTLSEILASSGVDVKIGAVLAKFQPGKIEKTTKENLTKKTPEIKAVPEKETIEESRHGQSNVMQFIESAQKKNIPNMHLREELRVPMSKLRQRIAERLKNVQNTAAMLTTFNEVDMSAINQLRTLYKESFEKKHEVKLGFMPFFVKACIQALKEQPILNSSIDGLDIVTKTYFDIGVAVSTSNGLVVPIIRDADKLNFSDIEKSIAEMSKRARDGKLMLEEIAGGTFTITNGGVFGSLLSTPIINPPQSAILGMHKIQERPVAVNGQIVIKPMMYLALSYDHRLIDGKDAVTFLVTIKECLENPGRFLLDL